MIFKSQQKYIRISPRKVQLVVDAIRELTPSEALEQLAFMRKAAATPVAKTIKQAMANAVKNANAIQTDLRFHSIHIGKGPTYKRWRAVSRGRAHPILKRTSHITVLLKEEKKMEKDQHTKSKNKTKKELTKGVRNGTKS